MSRRHVFFPVWRTRIVPWFIVLAMATLFAFGLILLVKRADRLITHPVLPAKIRLNQFVDQDR
jgi:hypothetical protein